MTEWENNHKVTCDECIHSIFSYDFVDELPFRINVKCKLGYETDYRVPYSTYWDCEYFVEWTFLNIIKNAIKKLFKNRCITMTEITVDSRLIIFCIILLLWAFGWGVYLQAQYNIAAIEIPDNAVYCVLGLIIGGITVHLMEDLK